MLKELRNTLANYAGGLTTLAAILVFNAVYFRMAGEEVFGLISLLLTVQLTLPAFDLGLGRTAHQAIALALADRRDKSGLSDHVLTLQISNLSVGVLIGATLVLAAPAAAGSWLRSEALNDEEIAEVLRLIGIAIPLMMARNFSTACLNGMKQQVLANAQLVTFTLLRGVVGVVVLYVAEDPLTPFFVGQLLVHFTDVLVSWFAVWKRLPVPRARPRFVPRLLRTSWRFAAGDAGANLVGYILLQADKFVLSALLPLSEFGAYALVSTVANGIGRFTSPFSAAFLPEFTRLMALGRLDDLRSVFVTSTQLLGCIILPVAIVSVVFGPEILAIVLGANFPLDSLPDAFAFLVGATILSNVMQLPHGIQLAAGNSMTAFRFNLVAAVIYVSSISLLTSDLGILAPAVTLCVINAIIAVFFVRVSLRLMALDGGDWLVRSVFRPAAAALLVALAARIILPEGTDEIAVIVFLTICLMVASCSALAISPEAAKVVSSFIRGRVGQDGTDGES